MATGSDEKEMKRQGGTMMSDAFTQLKTSSASDSPMRMLGALLKAALGAFLSLAGAAHGNMERRK